MPEVIPEFCSIEFESGFKGEIIRLNSGHFLVKTNAVSTLMVYISFTQAKGYLRDILEELNATNGLWKK